jgi:arylsulfatase A-like enzyme
MSKDLKKPARGGYPTPVAAAAPSTPHHDRPVSGVRFTDGFAAAPVCSPPEASILTGGYLARLLPTS